jgi:hypothetical protein
MKLFVAIALSLAASALAASAQTPAPGAASPFPVAVTLAELKREPPPRGTPAVVRARNGAELSGMFVKIDPDDTIDLTDVSGNSYEIIGATVEAVFLPDVKRLTADERKGLARLKPGEGKLRELAGARRVYVWSNSEGGRDAVLSELGKYGALEAADSFRDADFALYFAVGTQIDDPRVPMPYYYGTLYAYAATHGKPLRVLWQRKVKLDVQTPIPGRTAAQASAGRGAAELTRDFVKEHGRQAAP